MSRSALRQALVRGLQAHWGPSAGQQAAGVCSEASSRALATAKVHAANFQPAAAAAAAACQQAGGLRSLLRLPLPPAGAAAAAAGLRSFSSSTARGTMQETAQRLKSAAASSANAVKAVGSTVAKAPEALYKALPTSAQQLVNATQTPGALHRVISLQLTAFWQHHHNSIIAAGAVVLCYAMWRIMYRTSQLFVDLSNTMAASGFFALAASVVAFGYLYLRRRYSIDPQQVYRMAMYRLNTHPGLLEVMGAPLAGSPVQASVVTGGGIHFKGLRPRLQSKRIQMIFPLKGAERRGLVSLEAKKRHGQLRFKLLAVDVPCVGGGEQRIFLEGGPSLYDRGGVMEVLRDPFVKALSLEETFQAEDEAEDAAEEAERQAAAAQRAQQAAAKQPKPLDAGGGMYFWERVLLAWKSWRQQAASSAAAPPPPLQRTAAAAPPPQQEPAAAAAARAA